MTNSKGVMAWFKSSLRTAITTEISNGDNAGFVPENILTKKINGRI